MTIVVMDSKINADNQWYASPLIDLKQFLDDAWSADIELRTYFPRLTVLRSPLDSYKVNLMVKCLCHKSRETATTTAEQLFCLHDPVPVLNFATSYIYIYINRFLTYTYLGVLNRPPVDSIVKEEDYHLAQLSKDFVSLTNCSHATSKNIFEKDLLISNLLPDNIDPRKDREFEALNNKKNLKPNILRCHFYAAQRNQYCQNPQKKSNYLRTLKYDRVEKSEIGMPEWFKPCEKDIIMLVTVVVPYNKILTQEEMRSSRIVRLNKNSSLLSPQTKFMVRGESTLMSLRKKLACVSDMIVPLEDGRELDQPDMSKSYMVQYPSSFIFIHNTFYIDYSMDNSQDISVYMILHFLKRITNYFLLSLLGIFKLYYFLIIAFSTFRPIREFMAKKNCFDEVFSKDMDGVKIIDLKLRLGQPYVFQHSGTCEHLIIFHDLRVMHKSDIQVNCYYLSLSNSKDIHYWFMKKEVTFGAPFVVEVCERLPSASMMFCDSCFKEFHFPHGVKMGSFRANPYFQMNRLTFV
uniref:snRNA-activating protein complex subunit 3 n=1 Tax=Heterorhabditis bacteriophora TaxID=37862 RepID=A0A1I7XEI8_HETBA